MCGSVVDTSGLDLCVKYAQNLICESDGNNVFADVACQPELAWVFKVEKECLLE